MAEPGMNFKFYKARIEGTAALLQQRFGEDAEEGVKKGTRTALIKEQKTPREEAEKVSYRLPSRQLYLPAAAIARLIRESGSDHKLKGTRKSVKFVIPSAVLVQGEHMPLVLPDTSEPIMDFEVDSRSVVIPSTKGRIMKHRPRVERWAGEVILRIDEDALPSDFIRQLLIEGGMRRGVGDFRPEKGGPFGCFHVTGWQQVERPMPQGAAPLSPAPAKRGAASK